MGKVGVKHISKINSGRKTTGWAVEKKIGGRLTIGIPHFHGKGFRESDRPTHERILRYLKFLTHRSDGGSNGSFVETYALW